MATEIYTSSIHMMDMNRFTMRRTKYNENKFKKQKKNKNKPTQRVMNYSFKLLVHRSQFRLFIYFFYLNCL